MASSTGKIYLLPALLLAVLLPATLRAQHPPDTVSVYFPFNVRQLDEPGRRLLDSLVYHEQITPAHKLKIMGYADYVGSNEYNQLLSQDRARAVQQYLASLGIGATSISLITGKGEVARETLNHNLGYGPDRRVDIVKIKDGETPVARPVKQREPVPEPKRTPARPDTVIVRRSIPASSNVALLTRLKPNQSVVLNNIYFYAGRHTITPESTGELDLLYDVLDSHPTMKVRIEGHVCCVPHLPDAWDEDSDDFHLSVNRAKVIYDYLVAKGIDASRLQFAGYGRSRPVVPFERTEAEANKNRRVEIRMLEQ
jgi:outer membrane protein OmpA-like peptidoglycan-associated protein